MWPFFLDRQVQPLTELYFQSKSLRMEREQKIISPCSFINPILVDTCNQIEHHMVPARGFGPPRTEQKIYRIGSLMTEGEENKMRLMFLQDKKCTIPSLERFKEMSSIYSS